MVSELVKLKKSGFEDTKKQKTPWEQEFTDELFCDQLYR